jgi:tRNA1Val (adenine37-N6)-methyltransferase
MSNTYFQFKQFIIHQDQCAMKVCTDACLFGAFFSEKIPAGSRVLDIGSGTGLLMLMLAQKHNGTIAGIELAPSSFRQSQQNIARSKWAERLEVFSGDARDPTFPYKYDLIISNPPFFEGDLPAASHLQNLAKHSQELTLSALLETIDANLEGSGSFGVLLPYHRTSYFEELASARHFYLREKLLVRQTPGHDYFRSILHFSRDNTGADQHPVGGLHELTIKGSDGSYSREFIELLKDYYLYL